MPPYMLLVDLKVIVDFKVDEQLGLLAHYNTIIKVSDCKVQVNYSPTLPEVII